MRRPFVDALVAHRDRELFLVGLCALAGFRQAPIGVRKSAKGTTTYTLRLRLTMALDALSSFTTAPLFAIFYLGAALLLLAGASTAYLLIRKIFWGAILPGWASMIVSLWFFGGLNLFCIGVVGLYLAKVFAETKDRPFTVIRRRYEHSEAPADSGAPRAGG